MSLTSLHRVFAPNGICLTRWIQSVDRRVELHEPEAILDWVDSDPDKRVLPSSDTSPSFRMGSVRKIEGGIVTTRSLEQHYVHDHQTRNQKRQSPLKRCCIAMLLDRHSLLDRLHLVHIHVTNYIAGRFLF
jgi:hypothetical protein